MLSGQTEEILSKPGTIPGSLMPTNSSGLSNINRSLPVEEAEEDGILLEKPNKIKDDNLVSLLPSIRAVVTAYTTLKSKQILKMTDEKGTPLSKLTGSSVTSDQNIREIISELKKNKKLLAHGAVKKLTEILDDGSASVTASTTDHKEEKTASIILIQSLYTKAEKCIVGALEIPAKTFSAVIEAAIGVSVSNQKETLKQLASAVVRKTKSQHIVEIIDSCITAKDCKESVEKTCDDLIKYIKEIENIHVPPLDNISRYVTGRNASFETDFSLFCNDAIALIENIKKYKLELSSELGSVDISIVALQPENASLLVDSQREKTNFEEEKKSNRITEKNLKDKIQEIQEIRENVRNYEAKLALETKARHDLEEEAKLLRAESSLLTQHVKDSEEFFNHTIELKDSQNKCFLLFASVGGSSVLCLLFGVGISAWWLIPVGLFIGSVYYAYNNYKEHLQVGTLEEKMTLQEKNILENSTTILLLKFKNKEQKSDSFVAQFSEIKPTSLTHLDTVLKSPTVTSAPKKIQREIYGIFQDAINNTLRLESITEENISTQIHGAYETLAQKRQRSKPYFFGKTQHAQIDALIFGLEGQTRPGHG